MLAIDLAVAVAILGIATIGIGVIRSLRTKQTATDPRARARRARQQGEHNLEELEVNATRRCVICDKDTSPDVDVFTKGSWWHKGCYQKAVR